MLSASGIRKNNRQGRVAKNKRHSSEWNQPTAGRSEIYAGINRDTLIISQAAGPLIIAFQAALMVFFTFLYRLPVAAGSFFKARALPRQYE
jgi:putative ATP-binding cassette transporter